MIQDLRLLEEEDITRLLESRNAKVVHADSKNIIAVTKDLDGKRRNLVIMRFWHNNKYEVIGDEEYSIIGRFLLKLGIWWIGVKKELK